eukprot:765738-Hanusia_phi.AAC.9
MLLPPLPPLQPFLSSSIIIAYLPGDMDDIRSISGGAHISTLNPLHPPHSTHPPHSHSFPKLDETGGGYTFAFTTPFEGFEKGGYECIVRSKRGWGRGGHCMAYLWQFGARRKVALRMDEDEEGEDEKRMFRRNERSARWGSMMDRRARRRMNQRQLPADVEQPRKS